MTQITVLKKDAPAPNRKQWTITDTAGLKWKVWPDKIGNFVENNTYEITYKVNNFNGQTLNVIETFKPISIGAAGPAAQAFFSGLPPTAPVAATIPNYTKDEMIFTCGALNHALGAGLTCNKANVLGVTNMLREVWAETFASHPFRLKSRVESGPPDDMADEIPEFR